MSDDEDDRLLIDEPEAGTASFAAGRDDDASMLPRSPKQPFRSEFVPPEELKDAEEIIETQFDSARPLPHPPAPPSHLSEPDSDAEEGEIVEKMQSEQPADWRPKDRPAASSAILGVSTQLSVDTTIAKCSSGASSHHSTHSGSSSLLGNPLKSSPAELKPSPSLLKDKERDKDKEKKRDDDKASKEVKDDEMQGIKEEPPSPPSTRQKHSHVDIKKEVLREERKRVKEEGRKRTSSCRTPETKRAKKDASTCVRTIACQNEAVENFFEQPTGTQGTLNYTVVCKTEGNAMYISVRYNDREYFGFIDDGQPIQIPLKKRNVVNGSAALNRDRETDDKEKSKDVNGSSTPQKTRPNGVGSSSSNSTKRAARSSLLSDKRRNAKHDDASDEDEDGPTTTLEETKTPLEMHTCGIRGCEHRYDRFYEMEYHKANAHPEKKKTFDSRGSQTVVRHCSDRGTSTDPVECTSSLVQTDSVAPPVITGLSEAAQQQNISQLISKSRQNSEAQQQAASSSASAKHAPVPDASDDDASQHSKKSQLQPARNVISSVAEAMEIVGPSSSIAIAPPSSSTLAMPIASVAPAARSAAFQISDSAKQRPASTAPQQQQQQQKLQVGAQRNNAVTTTAFPQSLGMLQQIGLLPNSNLQMAFCPMPQITPTSRNEQHKIHELNQKNDGHIGIAHSIAGSKQSVSASAASSPAPLAPFMQQPPFMPNSFQQMMSVQQQMFAQQPHLQNAELRKFIQSINPEMLMKLNFPK